MENVFLNQTADRIRSYGYTEIANPKFAVEIMLALPRPEFAAVQYIDGVGQHAVCGFIFLPRAKQEIAGIITRELAEIEGYVASYKRALVKLNT